MSAVLQATRTPVDRDGRHWECHGYEAMIPQRASTAADEIDHIGVHTQRHPLRAQGQAHVVVQTGAHGFSFSGWLTPAAARAYAAQLLTAADRADEVHAFIAAGNGGAA